MAFVHALAVICQQVLLEKDDVSSAIRIAEIFQIHPQALEDPEKYPVPVTIYISIRVTEDDTEPHNISLEIERPSGEIKENVLANGLVLTARFAGTHRCANIHGYVGVRPTELGNHTAIVKMDGKEITRAYFTLRTLDVPVEGEKPIQ
jgi:hypothetical protein